MGRKYNSDNQLIEELVDNGDGTGIRTTYNPDGTIATTVQVTGLPIPEPPEPTPEEQIAELRATIDALLDALGGDDGPED